MKIFQVLKDIFNYNSSNKKNDDINESNGEDIKIVNKNSRICSENEKLIENKRDRSIPLVSLIIVNTNSINHLKRFFKGFKENTIYLNYEFIIVDNICNHESLDYLKEVKKQYSMRVIENKENKTFSQVNNEAVKLANGEFILLINNNVEPTYGWLNGMMKCALKNLKVGVVGAKLVYHDCNNSLESNKKSFKIQNVGIMFKKEKDCIVPINRGNGLETFHSSISEERKVAAVSGEAMLVRKELYIKVGGLDEDYINGYEDVDFSLKLLKKGYMNIYCPTALLFYYEFETEGNDNENDIGNIKSNNKKIFKNKWYNWLKRKILEDKLENKKVFTDESLKVKFVIPVIAEKVTVEEQITDLVMGKAMKRAGWEVDYLTENGKKGRYDVEDADLVISVVNTFNPKKIISKNKDLIKIALMKNCCNLWIRSPGYLYYDLVFACSKTACNYAMKLKPKKKVYLLPIAAMTERFKLIEIEEFICDYCCKKNYWSNTRDSIKYLEFRNLPCRFNLYDYNIEKNYKFNSCCIEGKKYFRISQIDESANFLIDDVHRVIKLYKSVNRRVSCGIANRTLEINNKEVREDKINELMSFIFNNSYYNYMLKTIKDVIKVKFIPKYKICIKIPVPIWSVVLGWGDYYFSKALKKEFERNNCEVIVQAVNEWYNNADSDCDAVIVLRGLNRYEPKYNHINIMWNISHPDKVSIDEYNQYDYVFIASNIWAKKIDKLTKVKVQPMLQCTDLELFYPEFSREYNHKILFVGNSRKVYRKIIKDIISIHKYVAIYGRGWGRLVSNKYIKGKHIKNEQLRKAYSSCKILLNDHWDDMRDKGFISNRIFDGLASGAFIISDRIKGYEEVFGDALITYETPEELKALIDKYLKKPHLRKAKIQKGREIVIRDNHTFKNRVEMFLKVMDEIKS